MKKLNFAVLSVLALGLTGCVSTNTSPAAINRQKTLESNEKQLVAGKLPHSFKEAFVYGLILRDSSRDRTTQQSYISKPSNTTGQNSSFGQQYQSVTIKVKGINLIDQNPFEECLFVQTSKGSLSGGEILPNSLNSCEEANIDIMPEIRKARNEMEKMYKSFADAKKNNSSKSTLTPTIKNGR